MKSEHLNYLELNEYVAFALESFRCCRDKLQQHEPDATFEAKLIFDELSRCIEICLHGNPHESELIRFSLFAFLLANHYKLTKLQIFNLRVDLKTILHLAIRHQFTEFFEVFDLQRNTLLFFNFIFVLISHR